MWDLPRPGLEPMSPALAGGFLTTAPPGKSTVPVFDRYDCILIWVLGLSVLPADQWNHCWPTAFTQWSVGFSALPEQGSLSWQGCTQFHLCSRLQMGVWYLLLELGRRGPFFFYKNFSVSSICTSRKNNTINPYIPATQLHNSVHSSPTHLCE